MTSHREDSALVSRMVTYEAPKLETEVALVRSRPLPSGESTLSVAVRLDIPDNDLRALVSVGLAPAVDVVRASGKTDRLTPDYVPQTASPFFGEVISGLSFVLPADARLVRVTVFVGPSKRDAARGVFLEVPVARVPLVDESPGREFHPFGISPSF